LGFGTYTKFVPDVVEIDEPIVMDGAVVLSEIDEIVRRRDQRVGVRGGADIDRHAREQPVALEGAVAVQGVALRRRRRQRDRRGGATGRARRDDAVTVGHQLTGHLVLGVLQATLDLEVLGGDDGLKPPPACASADVSSSVWNHEYTSVYVAWVTCWASAGFSEPPAAPTDV
jgi:hypothetical protein